MVLMVDALLLSFSDVNEETVTLFFNFEFNAMLSSNELKKKKKKVGVNNCSNIKNTSFRSF